MKKFFSALVAGILALTTTACGAAGGTVMELGTGSDAGVYYSYGKAMSQVIPKDAGLTLNPRMTEGSKENIEGIRSGELQLGMVQSDVMTYAWQGRRSMEQVGRVDSFRAVAGLYGEAVQLITMDPAIEEVDDLRGRTVSVGAKGSGVYFNAFDLIDAAGLTMSDINPVYKSFAESMEAMKNLEIDAAFIVAGTPTPAVTELFRDAPAFLVPIDPVVTNRLKKSCPFYTEVVIPAGSYAAQDHDIKTVGVTAMLVASADASTDDIYNLTKALFEQQGQLSGLHGKGGELNLQKATEVTTAPFHPGAVKYYREQGLEIKQ